MKVMHPTNEIESTRKYDENRKHRFEAPARIHCSRRRESEDHRYSAPKQLSNYEGLAVMDVECLSICPFPSTNSPARASQSTPTSPIRSEHQSTPSSRLFPRIYLSNFADQPTCISWQWPSSKCFPCLGSNRLR